MRMAGRLALISVFGFVCVALGARIEADREAPAPAPAPPPKVIVEKQDPVVEYKLPDDCKRAFDMAVRVREAADGYDHTSGQQLDIMDAAAKAIFSHDLNELNNLVTRQRALRDATVTPADTLHRELATFDLILGKCDNALENGG